MSENQKTETPAEIALRGAAKETKRAEKKKQILSFAQETMGCDKTQAKVFRKACKSFLKMGDDGLMFKGMGGKLVPVDSPQAQNFFKSNYPFLFKTAAANVDINGVNIDPTLVDLALAGNLTAKSKVARAFGADVPNAEASRKATEAADEFLKTEHAKRTKEKATEKTDRKQTNPWSPQGWNLTKQMAVFKSDPAMAQRLSKAAGSYIGATKPNKAA